MATQPPHLFHVEEADRTAEKSLGSLTQLIDDWRIITEQLNSTSAPGTPKVPEMPAHREMPPVSPKAPEPRSRFYEVGVAEAVMEEVPRRRNLPADLQRMPALRRTRSRPTPRRLFLDRKAPRGEREPPKSPTAAGQAADVSASRGSDDTIAPVVADTATTDRSILRRGASSMFCRSSPFS